VVLVLAASPLLLARPAVAAPCTPAGLITVKICPAAPTPGPPSAPPGSGSTPPRTPAPSTSAAAPSPTSPGTPSQRQTARPAQIPAPPTPGPVPSAGQSATGAVPAPVTADTSGAPASGAGHGAVPLPATPLGSPAGQDIPGPDGRSGLTGGALLALGGLLLCSSATIGLRRPARP
jgi:hypothetical protein